MSPARSQVVDLRQYTLLPGKRDALIELFDRYFVDGQEAVGSHVIGQYRDLDAPDRFVWMRGFDSMPDRAAALGAFYYGPVWAAHRERANATMADSDDVLLLTPLHLGDRYPRYGTTRPEVSPAAVVGVSVLYCDRPLQDGGRDLVLNRLVPQLAATGAAPVAVYVTETAENTFPALPVRAENVVAWVTRFDSDADYFAHSERLAESRAWRTDIQPALRTASRRPLQHLRLRPTARSHLC